MFYVTEFTLLFCIITDNEFAYKWMSSSEYRGLRYI